jgi:glycosyltransferase involved in cell wall biosynthesis
LAEKEVPGAMSKICIFGPSKHFFSGLSYYTIRVSNALAEENEVSVVLFRKLLPKLLFPGRKHVGKDLSDLNLSGEIDERYIDWDSPLSWLRAYHFLRRGNPQILIFQWWTSSVGHIYAIFKLINRLFLHKKIIVEFHEVVDPLEESILPIRIYSRIIGRIITKNITAITHSNADKELIAEKYRLPSKDISVIPLGPFDHFKKINKEEARRRLGITDNYVILYFGLIRKYKGVNHLVEGFSQIPEEKVRPMRLLVVGEVWDDLGLEELIEASPHRDKISLRDEYVPDDDVSLYFSAADLLVLPYLRASQSGVAHIAITYGIPVITTKVGGLAESMSSYEGATFISPGDPTEIKDEILRCFDISASRNIRSSEMGWEDIAKRYAEIFEATLR